MLGKFVITINRQFCSGGLEISEKLSQKLGVKFYGKEILSLAAKESGFTEKIFESADEIKNSSFLYSLVTGTSFAGIPIQNQDMVTDDKLFAIKSKVIREIAQKESCVLLGRCSDYILRDEKNVVKVYLKADTDFKVKRFINEFGEKENINQFIQKTDKKRASYYSYYTGNEWADLRNYDLVLNTSKIGIDNAVTQIISYLEFSKIRGLSN